MLFVKLQIITVILNTYKDDLGKHFDTYNNHCQRIYYTATILDSTEKNKEKYAIAAVFHDLGIWTNSTFDYLEPSIELCEEYLKKNNKEEWIEEISLMIDMHHKRSTYIGKYSQTVETFRKADWIDVTKRAKSFKFSRKKYKVIKKSFKTKGFHRFLVWQSFKNFIKHPFHPLPMFKK